VDISTGQLFDTTKEPHSRLPSSSSYCPYPLSILTVWFWDQCWGPL